MHLKPPYLANGTTYCTMPDGSRHCTGSMMGRADIIPNSPDQKLHLRRVPFVDLCYDQGGAYWGSPANLFCAWNEEATLFVRASSRNAAKELVRNRITGARFYR